MNQMMENALDSLKRKCNEITLNGWYLNKNETESTECTKLDKHGTPALPEVITVVQIERYDQSNSSCPKYEPDA